MVRTHLVKWIFVLVPLLYISCTKCSSPTALPDILFSTNPLFRSIFPPDMGDTIRFMSNTSEIVVFLPFDTRYQLAKSYIEINPYTCVFFTTPGRETSDHTLWIDNINIIYNNKSNTFKDYALFYHNTAYFRINGNEVLIDAGGQNRVKNNNYIIIKSHVNLLTPLSSIDGTFLGYNSLGLLRYENDVLKSNSEKVVGLPEYKGFDSVLTVNDSTQMKANTIATTVIDGKSLSDCYQVIALNPTTLSKDSPTKMIVSQHNGIVYLEWADGRTLTRKW